jgi:hypothetical protein
MIVATSAMTGHVDGREIANRLLWLRAIFAMPPPLPRLEIPTLARNPRRFPTIVE